MTESCTFRIKKELPIGNICKMQKQKRKRKNR